MRDSETHKSHVLKLDRLIKSLVRYLQTIEEPAAQQASTAYSIACLVTTSCGEIEGLGLLEYVKTLLSKEQTRAKPCTESVGESSQLRYIS